MLLDVSLDLTNRHFLADHTPTREPLMPVDHDAATVVLMFPPEDEGCEKVPFVPVTAFLPPDFFADLQSISGETREHLGDVMLRHSKSNVAMEARRIRLADRAAELHRGD